MENLIESEDANKYTPGVCNIGKAEIKARTKTMYFSLILLVADVIILELLHASHWWAISVFVFAASFAVSFQQVYFKFCVNFGMRGVFNFGDIGKTFAAEQKEYYQKDRAKAIKMITAGIVCGVGVALVYWFV